MKKYNITRRTLAILPFGESKSIIYEGNRKIICDKTPNMLINRNCIMDGSDLVGRQRSTTKITGNTYKVPILINEKNNIIFFPTASPRVKKVSWISLNNIEKTYYDHYKKVSVIIFVNEVKLEFDISLNIINNQIFKSTQLEHNIWKKNKLKR